MRHGDTSPSRAATRLLLASAISAAALASAGRATAQPAAAADAPASSSPLAESLTGPAGAEYEAGRLLFQDGDYANATLKFERAYALSREPRLLWNVALCQKNLKRYTRMLAALEQLQRDGGPLLSAQDREDAAELIRSVQAFVSPLELTVSEPGAAVFIDDERVGTTPLAAPILVDIGPRRIRVSKRGFRDHVVTREASGGALLSLRLTLARELHRGTLIVAAGPRDLISLDGQMVGRGRWGGVVPSGGHTLRVTADGMDPEQSEVTIQDDQVRRIDVKLRPQPRSGELARWLWVGGGIALFAATLAAGAWLRKPEPTTLGNAPPGAVQLSIGRPGPWFATTPQGGP